MTLPSSESLTARTILLLVGITILAAALRLPLLTESPPGLQHDEACNAWNAYCLLKTGKDASGDAWPIFHSRALGEFRSALFYYFLIPFQAIGGLNVTTTRMPAAVCGVLSIPLIFFAARRMFDVRTGLFAALLLAICGWHVQQNRIGHEAGIVPFLVLLSLSLALVARLPFSVSERPPSIPLAALAGLVWGASCYGYPGVRIFLPSFLILAVILNCRQWMTFLRSRGGLSASVAFVLGIAATLGPLVYMHVAHPEEIAKRGTTTLLWSESDSVFTAAFHVIMRYLLHFAPEFLFITGDIFEPVGPPMGGQMPWYSAPLLIFGVIALVRLVKSNPAAKVLLAGLIAYPIGDSFNASASLHTYRSFAGVPMLILLAAMGASELLARARAMQPTARKAAITAAGMLVILEAGVFYKKLFVDFPKRMNVFHFYKMDLIEACRWLEPRLADAHRVYFTMDHFNMSYMPVLVTLDYSPQQWFADKPDIRSSPVWDYCFGFGKFRFLQDQAPIDTYDRLHRADGGKTVYFVVRPDELPAYLDPVHVIRRPSGEPCLMVYEMEVLGD